MYHTPSSFQSGMKEAESHHCTLRSKELTRLENPQQPEGVWRSLLGGRAQLMCRSLCWWQRFRGDVGASQ